MTPEERRAVDECCLKLLAYQVRQWLSDGSIVIEEPSGVVITTLGPSSDERYVVPLAEALRARGWVVTLQGTWIDWRASLHRSLDERTVCRPDEFAATADEFAATASEALAVAAWKAIEQEENRT